MEFNIFVSHVNHSGCTMIPLKIYRDTPNSNSYVKMKEAYDFIANYHKDYYESPMYIRLIIGGKVKEYNDIVDTQKIMNMETIHVVKYKRTWESRKNYILFRHCWRINNNYKGM